MLHDLVKIICRQRSADCSIMLGLSLVEGLFAVYNQ